MAPRKACSCVKHNEFCQSKDARIYQLSSRKFNKSVTNKLLKLGYLKPKSTYLCTECALYTEKHLLGDEQTRIDYVAALENVLDAIEKQLYSQEDMLRLCNTIGKSVHPVLWEEANDISRQYRTPHVYEASMYSRFLETRSPVLLSLLTALLDIEVGNITTKQRIVLVRAIENLYYVAMPTIVTPCAFLLNVLCYFTSGSKTVCNMIGSVTPGGGYTTVQKWLEVGTSSPNVCPQQGDVMVFFDNNQVIQRNWRVTLNYKTQQSVVTNIMYINLPGSDVQSNPSLSPYQWLSYIDNTIPDTLTQFSRQAHAIVDDIIDDFIDAHLVQVREAQSHSEPDTLCDHLDADVQEVCDVSFKSSSDPYCYLTHQHPSDTPITSLGDPVMCNPASYESLKTILTQLQQTTGNGGRRQWIGVGCDGSPYILITRMIQNWFVCPVCKEEIRAGVTCFMKHCKSAHDMQIVNENVKQHRMFQNILLVPGCGHIEMNLTRALFKLLWQPYLLHIAHLCGFRSPHALAYAQSAANHHKSWMILQIFMYGSMDEILVPYVRGCIQNGLKMSSTGFKQWMKSVTNAKHIFLWDVLQTFVVPLSIFRAAVRRNNVKIMLCSRHVASHIFYGMNNTTYQDIIFRDEVMRSKAPMEISTFLHQTEVLSVSGHISKGEGGDFVLEARNRRVKMWMPPGVPTEHSWQRSCRNLEKLENVGTSYDLMPQALRSPFPSYSTCF